MKKLILSTVGTSILSNVADKDERKLLYNNSNCISEKDCPENAIRLINNLEQKVADKLKSEYNNSKLRRLSAELNGIFGFYENSKIDKEDLHFLITTDTFQGKKCGNILSVLLSNNNLIAQIFTPPELTTRTKYDFEQGIKNLLKWCEETLTGFKQNGYEIIFNLTGSFKSLQGYMNTIAMFYADKIIYIFESEKAELIEIPKLPIVVDEEKIEESKQQILLMSVGKIYAKNELSETPQILLDEIDNQISLSVWGELLWNNSKQKILSKELIELPFLVYSDELTKLFNKSTINDRIKLQETIAKVSKILIENNGNLSLLKQDGGLLYDNFSNKKDENGNPIGHFRINQGDRVSCVAKRGKLFLRKFGRHDFVNDNP